MKPPTHDGGYNPFDVQQLKLRTRRSPSFLKHSLSLKTIVFLGVTFSTYFYFLVPLEYIRPDIIGWNRTAAARRALESTKKSEN